MWCDVCEVQPYIYIYITQEEMSAWIGGTNNNQDVISYGWGPEVPNRLPNFTILIIVLHMYCAITLREKRISKPHFGKVSRLTVFANG